MKLTMQDYNRIQRAINRDINSYFDAIDNNELEQDMIEKCYKEINADRELLNRIINTSTIQEFTYTELQTIDFTINEAAKNIMNERNKEKDKYRFDELTGIIKELIALKKKTNKYLSE